MKRSKTSLVFTVIGILMFLTGFVWLYVNAAIDRRGCDAAEATVSKLRQMIPVNMVMKERAEPSEPSEPSEPMDAPLSIEEIEEYMDSDDSEIPAAASEVPDYIAAPMWDMPVRNIDGVDYIAQLSIPSLDLDLPVASDWSYDTLAVSPCRYYGSAYTHNLVIMAHNYSRHFAVLRQLAEGDEIDITDVDGNVFRYHVECMETMKPSAVLDMIESDFDLSLFTCTGDGTMRICVRCSLSEDIPLLLTETKNEKQKLG